MVRAAWADNVSGQRGQAAGPGSRSWQRGQAVQAFVDVVLRDMMQWWTWQCWGYGWTQ